MTTMIVNILPSIFMTATAILFAVITDILSGGTLPGTEESDR